jgi:hypothetical protein
MKPRFSLAFAFATVAGSLAAAQTPPFIPEISVGPVVGTEGAGVQVAVPLVHRLLTLNSGVTALGLTHDITADDVHYHGKLNLGAVPVYLSVFPFAGNFHIDAGVAFNNNRLSVTATPQNAFYTINGHLYASALLGTLHGATHFHTAAPYFGIGWGDPFIGLPLTFTASAGALFEGTPGIVLSAPNAALIPGAQADIAAAQATLNHDASVLKIWPLVNIGLVYRF